MNGAKSWFTASFPDYWLYFLGGLFITVTLFVPQGLVGGIQLWLRRRAEGVTPAPPKGSPPSGDEDPKTETPAVTAAKEAS